MIPTRSTIITFLLCMSTLAGASQEKSVKETFKDIKNKFTAEKAFVLTLKDSDTEDYIPFYDALRKQLGDEKVTLEKSGNRVYMRPSSSAMLLTIYSRLPLDIRNRFILGEKKQDGLYLEDRGGTQAKSGRAEQPVAPADNNSKTSKNAYEIAEEEVAKSYKPDTSEKRSVWQQQVDYAEEQRARNFRLNRGKAEYENPPDYKISTDGNKGDNFVEYKINGKKYFLYSGGKNSVMTSTRRKLSDPQYTFTQINGTKKFDIKFTNPAKYPVIRRFDFSKPTYKTFEVDLMYGGNTERNIAFSLEINFQDTDLQNYFHGFGLISDLDGFSPNIKSGFFEILYYEPGMGGIIEARFELTISGGKDIYGKEQPELKITEGFLRARMKS